jgi:hypothetical protein
MIALEVGGEHVVVTVYGEADNPWWASMASELVDSIRFDRIRSLPAGSRTPQPWTGLVRDEPTGEPVIVHGESPTPSADPRITDEKGDGMIGSSGLVDIVGVDVQAPCIGLALCANFTVAGDLPQERIGDPLDTLVAYGLVIDRQGDGMADLQAGIDNAFGHRRTWRTDLRAGETVSRSHWQLPDGSVDAGVPWVKGGYSNYAPYPDPSDVPDSFPDESAHSGWVGVSHWLRIVEELPDPVLNFYVFAAAIRDGKVVAVDYAPDAGWLTAAPARS